jgi:twitching motility protein PilT
MSKHLGDVLLEQGVVDHDGMDRALATQAETGIPLGKAVVQLGLASEQQVVAAIARQLGMPFVDTRPGGVAPEAAALVPRALAVELVALPVEMQDGNSLVVAMADPGNTTALGVISKLTGMATTGALAVRSDLMSAIDHLADDDPKPAHTGNGSTPHEPPAAVVPDAPAEVPEAAVDESRLLAFERSTAFELDEVLMQLLARGGSDLHLTAGVPPTIRIHGELVPLTDYPVLDGEELQKTLYSILTQRQRERFENDLELDVSYAIPDTARFRVNVFQQRDTIGAVMRVIPFDIKSIEDLGIPPQVNNFAYLPRGFVLVTGPTGSGKSTTLAALIDVVNRERACHIMTIEDPIEFLHQHKRSVVNQRELGTDTWSFTAALKHVLRQDPDVILVGEMRDLETIQVALTAAETGHLVFGTLHTQDAPQTIDRVIDVFPPHQQEQIRVMLAGALQGVVCQQLLKTSDGDGRVAATEVMIATPAIRNLIREGKTHQMYSSLQAGKSHGMITMDQSLANLFIAGKITYDAAIEKCNSVSDFNRLAGRA